MRKRKDGVMSERNSHILNSYTMRKLAKETPFIAYVRTKKMRNSNKPRNESEKKAFLKTAVSSPRTEIFASLKSSRVLR